MPGERPRSLLGVVQIKIPNGESKQLKVEVGDLHHNSPVVRVVRPAAADTEGGYVGRRVEIPPGATVQISTKRETFEVRNWRGRPGHTPGATVQLGENKVDLNDKRSRVYTPQGTEIDYD